MAILLTVFSCAKDKSPGPDRTPPATITDLALLAADDTSITLGWTAPGDNGDQGIATSYDLRYMLDEPPPSWEIASRMDSLSAPREAGSPESAFLAPLHRNQVYLFRLRTLDAAGNASEFSNLVQGQTGDPEPPGPVTDLRVTASTPHSLTLAFTAPGDDGDRSTVAAYDIRESSAPLTDSTWAAATAVPVDLPPHPPGTEESFRWTGLAPESVHHVGVRGLDDAGKRGPVVDLEVTVPVDDVSPTAITDVAVTSTMAYRASLTWTAVGDDGMEGRAAGYHVRYRMGPIADETGWEAATEAPVSLVPKAPGSAEAVNLVELPGGGTVNFAVRAEDAAGNLGPVSAPASVYVAGPGRTWVVNVQGTGDAPTVQAAIDSAVTGDIVEVGPGRYLENIDFLGKDIVLRSQEGPEVTILDGSSRDSSVVVMLHDETRKAVLEGFTITGGRGWKPGGLSAYGGGIILVGASSIIRNNIITANSARIGGGLSLQSSAGAPSPTPTIEHNIFRENTCSLNGGAIAAGQVQPIIRENLFMNNTAYADGGAIWIFSHNGSFTVSANAFKGNVAGDHGAGVYAGGNYHAAPITIDGNLFVDNEITENHHDWRSGTGVAIAALSIDGAITHNTIVHNAAARDSLCEGGGVLLFLTDFGLSVNHNIIVSNQQCGIACWWSPTTATMGRNLLWNNEGGNLGVGDGACPAEWADSMIVADPLFCDPEHGDYRLASNSPAIQGKEVMGAFSKPGCGNKSIPAISPWNSIGVRYHD